VPREHARKRAAGRLALARSDRAKDAQEGRLRWGSERDDAQTSEILCWAREDDGATGTAADPASAAIMARAPCHGSLIVTGGAKSLRLATQRAGQATLMGATLSASRRGG
jgi:hypothetical protein